MSGMEISMKVTIKDLTKKFPGRGRKDPEVTAVNDFDFEIPSGELVGLLGPSGCGKSTTLLMICGLLKPTEGRIFFDEEDVTDVLPEERGVGLVFQNYALYPHMTVEQNIMFPLGNLRGKDRLSREEMKERALRVAKLVQIESLMNRRPKELSGGQQQRVAIARALVKMPRVLLMDEPLSNLDARLRLQTRVEIRRIQRETGITTIFVTHDQEEAMSISDTIVVMNQGVVQQIGRPQDVYDDPHNLFVARFLGTPPINVFEGQLRGGKVRIGDKDVFDVKDLDPDPAMPEAGATPCPDAGAGKKMDPAPQKAGAALPLRAGGVKTGPGKLAKDAGDIPVWVGIRPEGFYVDENGPLVCTFLGVEVMGRDVTVVSSHPAFDGETIRTIIDARNGVDPAKGEVCYRLRPGKVFIFSKETGVETVQEKKQRSAMSSRKGQRAMRA